MATGREFEDVGASTFQRYVQDPFWVVGDTRQVMGMGKTMNLFGLKEIGHGLSSTNLKIGSIGL